MIKQHRALSALSFGVVLSVMTFLLAAPLRLAHAQKSSAVPFVAQAAPASGPPTASQPRGPAAAVEARIADLHRKLHITPSQQAQFDGFADVMRANAKSMQDLFQQRAQHRDRTAPGQLHWYAQLATAHAEATNKLIPVFDTLYQSLTDKQKKAADAAFVPLRQARPRHKAG